MKDIYSYFENFKELDTPLYRIEREKPIENAIFLRIFKKEKEHLSYLGVTFIKPECFTTVIQDEKQFLSPQSIIKLHETPTLLAYIPMLERLLVTYFKKQYFHLKRKGLSSFEFEDYKKAL